MWKRSIQTNKEEIAKQLIEIYKYAQHVAAQGDKMPETPDLHSLTAKR